MVRDLETRCKDMIEHRKLLASCEAIASLSKFLSPFFEKLADMLNRILARFPNYAEHLERHQRRASLIER